MKQEEHINQGETSEDAKTRVDDGVPEPPTRYSEESNRPVWQNDREAREAVSGNGDFNSARSMANAAKIMALVSLVIGGVFLSSAALVVSMLAYRKTSQLITSGQQATLGGQLDMLSRSVRASVVVSILALALNAIALWLLLPVISDVMQTGDYSTIFGSSQQASPSTGSSSSIWG